MKRIALLVAVVAFAVVANGCGPGTTHGFEVNGRPVGMMVELGGWTLFTVFELAIVLTIVAVQRLVTVTDPVTGR